MLRAHPERPKTTKDCVSAPTRSPLAYLGNLRAALDEDDDNGGGWWWWKSGEW